MSVEPKDRQQPCHGRDPAAREALGARSLRERAQREPRLSRDEEEKAAVRMVPRGTGPQGLPARMPDGVGLAGGGDTRQKGRASLPRVTTIPGGSSSAAPTVRRLAV